MKHSEANSPMWITPVLFRGLQAQRASFRSERQRAHHTPHAVRALPRSRRHSVSRTLPKAFTSRQQSVNCCASLFSMCYVERYDTFCVQHSVSGFPPRQCILSVLYTLLCPVLEVEVFWHDGFMKTKIVSVIRI